MIIDLLQFSEETELSCDVLVVGAGAIGLTLATYLARNGIDVLVTESGGKKFEERAQELNKGIVTGRQHLGIHEGRARVLGGTTTLWGGQLTEFRPIDLTPRDWVEGSDWPISYSVIESYYPKVARHLELDNYPYEASEIWDRLKIPHPPRNEDIEPFFTRWLRRPNLAKLFEKDIEKNKNLRVALHSNVIDLNIKDKRILGAKVRNPAGIKFNFHARNVILACGTLETIRLLLASAMGKETPWGENRWLGRCFQDHLDFRAAEVIVKNGKEFSNAFDNIYIKKNKYQPKIRLSEKAQFHDRVGNIAASIIFESSLSEHIGNIKIFLRQLTSGALPEKIGELPNHIIALFRQWMPLVKRYLTDNRAFNLGDHGVYLNLHSEQYPMNTSSVKLSDTKIDKNGVPLIELNWRVSGAELKTMRKFCIAVNDYFENWGVGSLNIDPRLMDLDAGILDDCRDTNHQCGGVRMGANPNDGVVDDNLKVFGSENLYVAGACTFRTSSFANPTFTALALAMRLADEILTTRE